MAVVVLDKDEFRELYAPKFDTLSDVRIEGAFDTACLYLNNTDKSLVPYDPDNGVTVRKTLLYLLMCHVLSLSMLPNGVAGPMTSASEGSVSVGYGVLSTSSDRGKWYNLTPCGQAFWQAVKKYCIGGKYFAVAHVHPWG